MMKFTVSGTFQAEPLREPLRHGCEQLGLWGEYHFSSHQVFQDLHERQAKTPNDIHLVLIRLEDLLSSSEKSHDLESLSMSLDVVIEELVAAAETSKFQGTRLFLFGAPSLAIRHEPARHALFAQAEAKLVQKLERQPKCFVVSSSQLAALYPVVTDHQELPYHPAYYSALALGAVRKLVGNLG